MYVIENSGYTTGIYNSYQVSYSGEQANMSIVDEFIEATTTLADIRFERRGSRLGTEKTPIEHWKMSSRYGPLSMKVSNVRAENSCLIAKLTGS